MQLTRESSTQHLIRRLGAGPDPESAERWLAGNVIVSADHIIEGWTTGRDLRPAVAVLPSMAVAIMIEDSAWRSRVAPTILLLGTGTDRFLPDVELMAALAEQRVGLEIMSTPAACRTFNVLLQEQRRVVAALFNVVS